MESKGNTTVIGLLPHYLRRKFVMRDIQDLMDKGILRKETQGGRSTNYELIID